MGSTVDGWPRRDRMPASKRFLPSRPSDLYPRMQKRMRVGEGQGLLKNTDSVCWRDELEQQKQKTCAKVLDYSDKFAMPNMLQQLESGKYGSVTDEIEALIARKQQLVNACCAADSALSYECLETERNSTKEFLAAHQSTSRDVINVEDECGDASTPSTQFVAGVHLHPSAGPLVIIDSDDEESRPETPFCPFQAVVLNKEGLNFPQKGSSKNRRKREVREAGVVLSEEMQDKEPNGVYVGVEDDDEDKEHSHANDDGLQDIWMEMSLAMECSKEAVVDPPLDGHAGEGEDECDHSFIFKDDIGHVCRVCGIIQRSIETIIEFQYGKAKNTRTYKYDGRTPKDPEHIDYVAGRSKMPDHEYVVAEIAAHPRHRKQMKPHQLEGFNFLLSNLVTDNPGGCILAHAPGSGKTFMIISFLQSFMAKYPFSRPLVVLPRGILPIWKKEFKTWQVEDIPLLDFYSRKAESRSQQLEVLTRWAGERSILFLGYKQFSSIVCDTDISKTSTTCQEILITRPSILILDEGHTPRNPETNILMSLEKVETPRKVVLSGTLYQNHVEEVFNILNLVRPKFLRLDTSKAIKRRILSKVSFGNRRDFVKKGADNGFYEVVEHTLVKDEDLKRKLTIIKDLREMTSKVLHYYKGDFLDDLPGLVDFTILLQLSSRQQKEVAELKGRSNKKFQINAQGSAIYVHPDLSSLSKNSVVKERVDEEKIDMILEKFDEREGVKARFFLNLLQLCESSGEKLLVFSQYLLPLKFLEKLTMKVKGYSIGKEIFVITGDSDNDFRESSMERFNTSPDARVFFGSIKACGEGISLVGASRIIILDVPLNPSVSRQAIGRAFRPGQERKVFVYRLIASGSPEEEDHGTCFNKEFIAKMWFEWNEFDGNQKFQIEAVDVKDSGDVFLETPRLNEDVVSVYKR